MENAIKIIFMILGLILSGTSALGFFVLKDIGSNIDEMNDSIGQLNSKVAVVIERQSAQNEKLKDHEKRLRDIEKEEWEYKESK